MADRAAKDRQYQYTANSNLVLQANRHEYTRRDQEPTGEPESLWGRLNIKEMGSRALKEKPKELQAKKSRAKEKSRKAEEREEKRRQKREEKELSRAYGYSSVLAATEDFEGLNYRPRTKETRATYELLLSFVAERLGDQSQEVIRSAADDVLETLKTDALKDFDKKTNIESVIGQL